VNTWSRMTVSELAISAGRDINDVIDAISLSDPLERYNKDTIIENPKVLYNAVRKLGAKFKVIPRPDSIMEEDTKDCDVVKRYNRTNCIKLNIG